MSDILQAILNILMRMPDGAKISEITSHLNRPLPTRTLLRYLVALKKAGEITSRGVKSGTRYYIKQAMDGLPLSAEGGILKAYVTQPLFKRDSVAYHSDFLYAYRPNETFYLTQAEREHLMQLGQRLNREAEPGTYIKRMLHRALIDLSWNSSRLEGNTYSLLETERLIEFGVEVQGKQAFEAQMITNHKAAIEFMVECGGDLRFNEYIVLNIHALLSENLLSNPGACGRLRQIPVGIGRTVYQPPEIPKLIAECFQKILSTADQINDPFEQAFFAMVHVPYLQAFEDVNKRVSRLCANIPFIRHNLAPLSFVDVPQPEYVDGLLAIYELNKTELMRDIFIWAYERSAKKYQMIRETLGEPDLFRMRYSKELKALIQRVVADNLHGQLMLEKVQSWAQEHIRKEDRVLFIHVVEREIASLHAGNIAIYQIKPEVFEKWLMSRAN